MVDIMEFLHSEAHAPLTLKKQRKMTKLTRTGKSQELGFGVCHSVHASYIQPSSLIGPENFEIPWKNNKKSEKANTVKENTVSAIPFLDFYIKEMKAYVHTKSYLQIFLAALLVIVPNQK